MATARKVRVHLCYGKFMAPATLLLLSIKVSPTCSGNGLGQVSELGTRALQGTGQAP